VAAPTPVGEIPLTRRSPESTKKAGRPEAAPPVKSFEGESVHFVHLDDRDSRRGSLALHLHGVGAGLEVQNQG